MSDEQPQLYSAREAADLLAMNERTLRYRLQKLRASEEVRGPRPQIMRTKHAWMGTLEEWRKLSGPVTRGRPRKTTPTNAPLPQSAPKRRRKTKSK